MEGLKTPLQLRLEHAGWVLELSPETGGVITRCTYKGVDVLRPATEKWHRSFDPMQSSCFALFPYSNRIANGTFSFEGETHHIDANFPGIKHPLHGTAWLGFWEVHQPSKSVCELTYTQFKDVGAWPYPFEARQRFQIKNGALHVQLSIQNTGDTPMPAGMGWHPYFPLARDVARDKSNAHLKFNAKGVWLSDHESLPQTWVGLPSKWDFSNGLPVEGTQLDHCFGGWDGKVRMSWPDSAFALEMRADPAMTHVVVYTEEADSFCFEPASHMNDAINRMDTNIETGFRVLAPGETFTSTLVLDVKPTS
ncbi:MAG: hypothetical protein COA69_06150 [Robiginitomaculum sp.]|nr:MAG: hypothetical protein COA69_06150 [Robiginitomaculum sp.]